MDLNPSSEAAQRFQGGAAGSGLSSEDDLSSDSSEDKPRRHHVMAGTGPHLSLAAAAEEEEEEEEEEVEVEVEEVEEIEEIEEEEDRYRISAAAPMAAAATEETSNNNSGYRASRPVARRSKIIMPGHMSSVAASESGKSKSSSKAKNLSPGVVKYHECMKNHAASLGGHALDGCGEFLPSFADALLCSACGCHRNFHRRGTDPEPESPGGYICNCKKPRTANMHLSSGLNFRGPLMPEDPATPVSLPFTSSKDIIPIAQVDGSMSSMHYTDDVDMHSGGSSSRKKRYRTKFSAEQKEEMTQFADKLGWKIVRQHEDLVTQFCEDVGVPRNVFKVWMHNNKNNSAKRVHTGENMLKSESPSDY